MKCILRGSCVHPNRCCSMCPDKKCWQRCKDKYKDCKYFNPEQDIEENQEDEDNDK